MVYAGSTVDAIARPTADSADRRDEWGTGSFTCKEWALFRGVVRLSTLLPFCIMSV